MKEINCQNLPGIDFAESMCYASYTVGVVYNALKNRFVSYQLGAEPHSNVTSHLQADGEAFAIGSTQIAKITLADGYVRLYLALDHLDESQQDLSCPNDRQFQAVITIFNKQQCDNALELVDQLMEQKGCIVNNNYTSADFTLTFVQRRRKGGEFVRNGRVVKGYLGRLAGSGYNTGLHYNALKNALLAYQKVGKRGKKVKSRIGAGGETFAVGGDKFAKITVVGGYIRLFLRLDPTAYKQSKYNHKDKSGVGKYQNYPFMIKISSSRKLNYALELVADMMQQLDCQLNPNYQQVDYAIGLPVVVWREKAKLTAEDQDDLLAQEETVADSVEEQSTTQQDATVATVADTLSPIVPIFVDGVNNAKLPVYATVCNRYGEEIGRVRKCQWRDTQKVLQGTFVRSDKQVLWQKDHQKRGFVDKNNNIFDNANNYVATLRYARSWNVILAVLLCVMVVFSSFLVAHFIKESQSDIPEIFIADMQGASWQDTENIPVFFNEMFGDKAIAPGLSGSYKFIFRNDSDEALDFSIAFACQNQHNIGIVYRLKRDGSYIDDGQAVSADDLHIDQLIIADGSSSVFELEWEWLHNDAVDTFAGENNAIYTLTITITATTQE